MIGILNPQRLAFLSAGLVSFLAGTVQASDHVLPLVATSTSLSDDDMRYFDVEPRSGAEAPEATAESPRVGRASSGIDRVSLFGSRLDLSRLAGSAHVIDEEFLERWEADDVQRVLRTVPGVYVRDEDGFGLRPNIGMRGAFSDRSSKVTLMEDGILLKPAPYAAPAAYYFPLTTRMTEIEVFKGPAAIVAGPNTIGGAINLNTRSVPEGTIAHVDLAGGNTSYTKIHGYAGTGNETWGILLEGIHLRSAGFKELPSGNGTGFDRNDVMLKARLNTPAHRTWQHRLDLKLGWGSEVSNETYLGLADEDFEVDPLQRYAASELGRMEWDRGQIELAYTTAKTPWRLRVAGYYHPFARVWTRLDGFTNPDLPTLNEVLRNDSPRNEELRDVLRGVDSAVAQGASLDTTRNDRAYSTQGVQAAFDAELATGPVAHVLEAGARFHYDWIERDHTLRSFDMIRGQLVPVAATADDEEGNPRTATDNRDSALAASFHIKDSVSWGPLTVSPGVRAEFIHTRRVDRLRDTEVEQFDAIGLPGVGLLYEVVPNLTLIGGVHRGFSPVAPGQDEDVDPETSWNWEGGARYDVDDLFFELIGFFNDYENIVANCLFAAGCPDDIGDQDSLGSATVYGVEVNARAGTEGPFGLRYDVHVAYTFTRGTFDEEIEFSLNPRFSGAQPGDRIPDIPTHLGSFQATVAGGERWALSFGGFGQSRMIDEVERGRDLPDEFFTDAFVVFDATAHYRPIPWLELYVGGQNIFDAEYIASRRPFGARPGRPLFVYGGLELTYDGASIF